MMTRFLLLIPLALQLHAQPFSPQDPVFSQNCSSLLLGCKGVWRLEESSGTRYDLSGKNNNLTSNNSVGQAAGKVGNCATFVSPSSQSLSIASNSTLATGDIDFTLCAWAFMTNNASEHVIMSKHDGSTAAGSEYKLEYDNVSNKWLLRVFAGGAGTSIISTNGGAPSLSTWYFVLAWHDSVNNVLGITVNNGAADTVSYSSGVNSTSAQFTIGATGNNAFWSGNIDEPSFWKRILTTSEKSALYNVGLGTHTPWAHP